MSTSGPSKEELEMYWKNSRAYFDELAKHYKATDPEYYKKYIKPYYDNPFAAAPSKSNNVKIKLSVFLTAMLIAVIGIAGAVLFFVFQNPQEKPKRQNIKTVDTSSSNQQLSKPKEDSDKNDVNKIKKSNENFRIGKKYYEEKNYKQSEEYLKKVIKEDNNYREAQRILKEIEIKKSNDEEERPNTKVKPIRPIR